MEVKLTRGSCDNEVLVTLQRVLLQVFVNVPAGHTRPQLFFNHELQGSLREKQDMSVSFPNSVCSRDKDKADRTRMRLTNSTTAGDHG